MYSEESIAFIWELITKDNMSIEDIVKTYEVDKEKITEIYTIAKRRFYVPPAKSGKEIQRELPKEIIVLTKTKYCYHCI